MKTNRKTLKLIQKGLSSKTISKLTESQIDILYSKLLNEQPQPQIVNKSVKQIVLPSGAQTTVGGVSVSNVGGKTTVTPTTEEISEDDEIDVDPNKDQETQDPHQVGPSSNDGFGPEKPSKDQEYQDGQSLDETKKKKENNPWSICTAQLGDKFGTTERSNWTKSQMKKYERCVLDVKKSLKEGKNPVSLFIENEIMKIVEKNLPPRITKGDLVKYLTEAEPAVAPTKPKEKPKTEPRERPKEKPKNPFRNPNPKENPAPKAVNPEKAKDKVIDVIMKILKNA